MEKLIYTLWKSDAQSPEAFKADLLGEVSRDLLQRGARKLRVSVVDDAVAPAAALRQINSIPAVDAVVSLWVDTALYRRPYEEVLQSASARVAGYLVTESEAIVNTTHPARDGERVTGMMQIVFLTRPPRLSYAHWRDLWVDDHTPVGVETQANFGYRQNIVVRRLTYGAPACDGIVEENFPAAAMTSPHAFYDAAGDEAKYRARLQRMMESCHRFIDFDKIDVIIASEYVIKG
ncbi:MAG: EthD domain-containing protein [Candidatus Binatia bacterium]